MRSGPGTDYRVLVLLAEGEEVNVLGRDETGGWSKISVDSGEEGWVAGVHRCGCCCGGSADRSTLKVLAEDVVKHEGPLSSVLHNDESGPLAWGRQDLNSRAFLHVILNHARLPIPTLPHHC